MEKILFLLGIILSLSFDSYGQNLQKIDQLNREADSLLNVDIDIAIDKAQSAIDLSIENKYAQGKAEGLGYLGFASYLLGDYELGENYCNQSISISKKIHAQKSLFIANNTLGLINLDQHHYDDAIRIFMRLVNMAEEVRNANFLSDALSNLGLTYLNQKMYNKSKHYLLAARQIHERINHPDGQIYVYLNLGRLHLELNQTDSALHYLNTSYQMAKNSNNQRALLYCNTLLGQVSLNSNQLNKAEEYFTEAYWISRNLALKKEVANAASWLCECFYDSNNFDKAIQFGEEAIEVAKNARSIYIIQRVNNTLAKSYLEKGDYKTAEKQIKYQEHLIDSLALIDSTDLFSSMIQLKSLKDEEEQLELVNNQLRVAKAEITRRNTFIIGALLTFLLLGTVLILIINSNKTKTKTNEELLALNKKIYDQKQHLEKTIEALDKSNKEKDLLLGMVAHDMRSPLNKINGLMNILQKNDPKEDKNEIYELVQQTISDANKLADELLEINKIESGVLEKTIEKLKTRDFLKQIQKQYEPVASNKNIEFIIEHRCPKAEIKSDRKILLRIFENLVSNAIKFSEPSTTISLIAECHKKNVIFHIKDQGLGIPENEQKILFTKFGKTSTRPTHGEPSNGLGLYIVNELTKTLDGEISFFSQAGKGSQFSITIPV